MKDGILVINKPKNMTSREVVDVVCKKLGTRHIGHTGTLDPMATGVLVLGVNEGCKVIDLLTQEDKIYEAKVLVGLETDTLDITGNILNEYNIENLTSDDIEKALSKYRGKYNQEVPKYSAIHVDGKRLYEYARNNIDVELPKREVEIFRLDLKDEPEYQNGKYIFSIISHVSKGTYIRSLIRDIGVSLGYPCTMTELVRIKQGVFNFEQAINLDEVDSSKLLSIEKALTNIKSIVVDDDTANKVMNGAILELDTNDDKVLIMNNNELLAIYERYVKDSTKMKPYRVFRR